MWLTQLIVANEIDITFFKQRCGASVRLEDYRDATDQEKEEWEKWRDLQLSNTSYHEQVETLIREEYSGSQELAILRQQAEKPEEYQAYFDYCEECKAKVKATLTPTNQ